VHGCATAAAPPCFAAGRMGVRPSTLDGASTDGDLHATRERRVVQLKACDLCILGDIEDDHPGYLVAGVDLVDPQTLIIVRI
jgi:hypothetical protein